MDFVRIKKVTIWIVIVVVSIITAWLIIYFSWVYFQISTRPASTLSLNAVMEYVKYDIEKHRCESSGQEWQTGLTPPGYNDGRCVPPGTPNPF